LALAALALVLFGAYDSYPTQISSFSKYYFIKKLNTKKSLLKKEVH